MQEITFKRYGSQSIYASNGDLLLEGGWNPKEILKVLSCGAPEFWKNKTVLDIGANTAGLSLEIARLGASVCATEPSAIRQNMTRRIIEDLVKSEGLNLTLANKDIFDSKALGQFDVILCLGLLYHFRYPQYILDFLSTFGGKYLFISSQTHDGEDLSMINRKQILPKHVLNDSIILKGWHPSHRTLRSMIRLAGFSDIVLLTDREYNMPGFPKIMTNSAYYRAKFDQVMDPEIVKREFI